jgi:hypothetical protein
MVGGQMKIILLPSSWKPEKEYSSLYLPQDKAEKTLARGLIYSSQALTNFLFYPRQ